MNKIIWYFNRLRRMSLSEVAYRVRQIAYNILQKCKLFRVDHVPKPITKNYDNTLAVDNLTKYKTQYIDAADKIIKGQIKIFEIEYDYPRTIPDWNTDPKSGVQAPLSYGKSIDYRDNSVVGDIKYLWEPNRHLHLVVLAQAYCLTQDKKYLDAVKQQLDSWFEECPYLQGPNWSSSLELGIRLINWAMVWRLIGGLKSAIFASDAGKEFKKKWLDSIYQHTHFVINNLSRYSSANNHLIGELASVVVSTCTWPYWRKMHHWRKLAHMELSAQACIQNYADGVNKEQAISYQQFVCDFLIYAGLAAHNYELPFSAEYWQKIKSMLQYISSLMDVSGNVPMLGDADDGYVNILSQADELCPYRSLLAFGGIIFKNKLFEDKAGKHNIKADWLNCIYPNLIDFEMIHSENDMNVMINAFPNGGYYILGDNFGTKDEIKLVVDCGPLGFLSIAAHGHADALSVYLSSAGREFLIDPGTFSYHAEPIWRNYFKGTSAHNTVVIDSQDQSISRGNFMWSNHASSVCKKFQLSEETGEFIGTHDGYKRLDDPVTHTRNIKLNKVSKEIIIQDNLTCNKHHTVELFWHFSEHCNIEISDKKITANNNGAQIILDYSHYTDVKIYQFYGSEKPPYGWVSRSFGVKVPTVTISIVKEITSSAEIETRIKY